MKATLTFNLPEEDVEFRQAIDGNMWEGVVWNIHRACLKHGELYAKDDAPISTEDILGIINQEMTDKNLEFAP